MSTEPGLPGWFTEDPPCDDHDAFVASLQDEPSDFSWAIVAVVFVAALLGFCMSAGCLS